MRRSRIERTVGQEGFSLLEMLFATLILLVGLVAVAQLVPASILMNGRNRTDSSAMVFAQRELDQFVDQPLSSPSFTDVITGNVCNLGNAASPNTIQGSPLTIFSGQAVINFAAAPVLNYSFAYSDPNDPSGIQYDVRWAVILTGNGTAVSSKRFILGIRQQGGSGYFQPVTIDTMVEK